MRMKYCSIKWVVLGVVVTFDTGEECVGVPHDTHHYHVVSHRLGYGGDVMRYCREHELAHVVLAQELHQGPPLALLDTARYGAAVDQGLAVMEECTAQALQRWVRASELPIIGDCDWVDLRDKFLACVAELDREYKVV